MSKISILAHKFKNNSYFTDLSEYIKENVKERQISYDNLKYLYKSLYKNHSQFIRQNIYPVCEFLKKGYSIEECEKLTSLLEDASDFTIFCYNKKEKDYKYNKLFYDLQFVYEKYDEFFNLEKDKDASFSKVMQELRITSVKQRQIEMQLLDKEYIDEDSYKYYQDFIIAERKKLKNELREPESDYSILTKKLNSYNRLNITRKMLVDHSKSLKNDKKSKDYIEK